VVLLVLLLIQRRFLSLPWKHSLVLLILVHNHLSENIQPSEPDISITKKIIEAGKMPDIAVLDHIIVGLGYYSFADEGTM